MSRNTKAFLKSGDGAYYQLAPKVTTIGKENCDILLQTNGVDQQHAIIEYSEQEDCYVLQDLNSGQGTYVNDVRVQNAAVRLAPGDVIRFGYCGQPYELNIDNPPPPQMVTTYHTNNIAYPPVQHRPAWTGSLALLTDDRNMCNTQANQNPGLPYLTTPTLTVPATHWTPVAQAGPQIPQPRPPLRSRPLSAGAQRRPASAYDRLQTIGCTMQSATTNVASPLPRIEATSRYAGMTTKTWSVQGGGWMNGGTGRSVVTSQFNPPPPSPQQAGQFEMGLLQEKEHKIRELSEEVSRLRNVEMDVSRKDQMLQQMQQQLQMAECQAQQQAMVVGSDPDVTNKLLQFEAEVSNKKQEILDLREQLSQLQAQAVIDLENPANIRAELSEKIKELNNMRNELERVKKDKNITSGLVTQMQRDMGSKDSSISKLTREIEALKKELREKDSQLKVMTSSVNKLKEPKTEERDARERELISLRQKFKVTENKVSDQQTLIDNLRVELEKTKASLFQEKDVQRKLQSSLDEAKSQAQDLERAERLVRVDLEQVSKKNERFRNRVVQTTFSTPGIKAPDTEISDDDLLETLKKIIDERTNSFRTIKELEQKLKMADTNSKDFQKNVHDLRKGVQNAKAHLKQNGRLSSSLKEEIGLLQSVSVDDHLAWVKEVTVGLLQGELSWETDIENALEKCGVNLKLTNDEPSKHINLLFAKWESAISDKERLVKQMSEIEVRHKEELELQISQQKTDLDGQVSDAVEKAKLEVEERMNRAIDDIRAVEQEKLDSALQAERRKIEELETTIEQLRYNLSEKNEDQQQKLEAGQEALSLVEEYQTIEAQLKEQVSKLEVDRNEQVTELTTELVEKEHKFESDLQGYKEQIKQHSVTICAMEERISKVMKKNKESQEEMETYRKQVQELKLQLTKKEREKPPPPPKPKVIPVVQKPSHDIVAMEQLIVVLRKENAEVKTRMQEQDDVILGLRRDLVGASARLSDITGELSEGQKQEVEKLKEVVSHKEREVVEMRQQLAKLSRIIDKQKEELKSIECELSKEKSISNKYKSQAEQECKKIQSLKKSLDIEKNEQAKQLELMDQEGRITSELTALGAQCRGERHEQVIARQREALAELRSRVKTLEVARPPVPTQDQALQQVIMLKKELAEMRVNQALSEDKNIVSLTSLDREVGRARGLVSTTNADAEMERSAHRETMEALEASENSYLTSMNAISSSLDLEGIEGLRPLGHIPKDERERLLRERERSCDKLVNQVRVYRERISRKDELLQGYERDLAKLRQAQELAERKSVQLDTLANDVRCKHEESQYLRESLHQTRDKLDQEKRLNTAIKQRKTFHLENEKVHLAPASHRCKPEDPRAVLKKKRERDVLKRKNYEIKTLKTELTDKERNLFDAQNRLYTLSHSQYSKV
ncbi:forkhead-associated domain-containing protein 1-like isoform X2 [Mya arenaria]|uniref:forkhead-associated domain-containing protein 1-like isoform X2 n=1 Tax=Mya arenaria TaxID=6604 RepID=UPI0022E12BAF|nr:forkhead-associated domain-containing protein 1-like isoform X2 [Mya arenaria]XP_052821002.1 forkhead-associated domain-containing protein 1-like isoform X2 [Mya arenaria]